jgi:hypothetical protein
MSATPAAPLPHTKVCTKCGETKYAPEFYLDRKTGRRRPDCKECRRAQCRRYYAENGPACRERARRYRARHPERAKAMVRDWKRRHPERVREYWQRNERRYPKRNACRRVSRGLREMGLLDVGDACEDCGGPADLMHHPDYTNPWRVVPLCTPCHMRRHNAVWRREGGGPVKYPEEYGERDS